MIAFLQHALFALRRYVPSPLRQVLKPFYRQWWQWASQKQLAQALARSESGTLPYAGYAVLYFSAMDGERQAERPPHWLMRFAQQGHRIFHPRPDLQPGHPTTLLEPLAPNVFGLSLPGSAPFNEANRQPTPAQVETWLQVLNMMRESEHLHTVVSLVQSPFWEPLALAARERWDWKIVYNCLDAQTLNEHIRQLYGRVAIVIVSYHSLDYLRLCLESVWAKTDYPNYEVIVVDNGSSVEVRECLQQSESNQPRLRVIFNSENLGFARANNLGLETARARACEYVVLLNNDTIVTHGWLTGLVRHLQCDPAIGMVGPVTNWASGESRVAVEYKTVEGLEPFAERYTQAHAGLARQVSTLDMFCVALPRHVIETVGLLDESFGLGMFEDYDYAMSLRRAGYRLICAADVFVHHWGWASFGRLDQAEYDRLFEGNRRRFEEKWGERWERPPLNLQLLGKSTFATGSPGGRPNAPVRESSDSRL